MKDEHKQTKNDKVYVYSSFKKFLWNVWIQESFQK